MQANDKIKNLLRSALAMVDQHDSQSRLSVYKAAIASAEKMSDASRPGFLNQITLAIKELENEFSAVEQRTDMQADAAHEIGEIEQIYPDNLPGSDAPEVVSELPPDSVNDLSRLGGSSEYSWRDTVSQVVKFPSGIFAKRILLLAGAVIVIGFFGLGMWHFGERLFGIGAGTPSESSPVESRISESTSYSFVSNFPDQLDQWSDKLGGRDTDYANFLDNGRLVLKNELQLHLKEYLPVDPSKVYLMEVEFEFLGKPAEPIRLRGGVVTFDAEKRRLRSKPGTHRYFLNNGEIEIPNDLEKGGSFKISGIITDEGDETHLTFRPLTSFVKPVLLFSYGGAEPSLALKSLSFESVGD